MRYLIGIILLGFLTVSCSGPETIARDEVFTVTGYDFSEYTEQGFLFTPEQYRGEYQSIGLITVTQWPAVRKTEQKVRTSDGAGYKTEEVFYHEAINVEKTIEEIYKIASDMGADAVTQFNVTPTSRTNGTLNVPGVEISGFAIDRTDN